MASQELHDLIFASSVERKIPHRTSSRIGDDKPNVRYEQADFAREPPAQFYVPGRIRLRCRTARVSRVETHR